MLSASHRLDVVAVSVVFSQLSNIADVLNGALVCKDWLEASKDDIVWRSLFYRYYPLYPPQLADVPFKFSNHYELFM